jgi:hypothetical protein
MDKTELPAKIAMGIFLAFGVGVIVSGFAYWFSGWLPLSGLMFFTGGVGVPLITTAGFLAVYLSFLAQKEANQQQEKALEEQQRATNETIEQLEQQVLIRTYPVLNFQIEVDDEADSNGDTIVLEISNASDVVVSDLQVFVFAEYYDSHYPVNKMNEFISNETDHFSNDSYRYFITCSARTPFMNADTHSTLSVTIPVLPNRIKLVTQFSDIFGNSFVQFLSFQGLSQSGAVDKPKDITGFGLIGRDPNKAERFPRVFWIRVRESASERTFLLVPKDVYHQGMAVEDVLATLDDMGGDLAMSLKTLNAMLQDTVRLSKIEGADTGASGDLHPVWRISW